MDNKLTIRDMFNTEKVTGPLFLYNIGVLVALTLVILFMLSMFIWPNEIIGYKVDKLSVGRTEDPLNSHLYRTRDPVFETQSLLNHRTISPCPCDAGKLSHVEPWDRWNPPYCGGMWTYDSR